MWNSIRFKPETVFLRLCLAAFISTQALASSAPNGPNDDRWPLKRIISRAMERAPEIKALSKDIERAENLAMQAGRWDNPDAGVAFGPMKQEGISGHSLDVSLKQNVPIFGQKAIAQEMGQQNKVTVQAESQRQLLIVKHEVIRLAYRLAALEEQANHVTHRREKMNIVAEFLRSRPFASPTQSLEKSLVLNRLREVEEELLKVSALREGAWQGLNVFLDERVRVLPQVKWNREPRLPDRSLILKKMQSQNPELARYQSLVSSAELEAKKAGKKAFPEIRVGAAYNEQTADLPQRIYAGSVEFSIPIFDRGGYAKQAALAEKEAAIYRLEQKGRELNAEFEQTWVSLEESKKRVELYPTSLVEVLEAQMNSAEKNWKKGQVQVAAFLELENQIHEQATKVFDAQAAFIENRSHLDLLAGQDFELEEP